MTKQELLKDLEGKSFVASVGTPKIAHPDIKHDGGKWYSVDILDVDGDAAQYRTIHFYVVNEGKSGETAYYKDKLPTSNVKKITLPSTP